VRLFLHRITAERNKMTPELKQDIVDFIKSTNGEHSAINLRQLFHVTSKQLDDEFKNDARIEVVRYGTGVIKFKYKRDVSVATMENKRMTSVYKPDLALQMALDRCAAERGGEFSNKSLVSNVREFDNLAGR
jgi:hypothetical protein